MSDPAPPGLPFRSPPAAAAVMALNRPAPGLPFPMDEDAAPAVVRGVAVVGTVLWEEEPTADVGAAAAAPPDLVTKRVLRKFPRLLKLRLTCVCASGRRKGEIGVGDG